MTNNALPSSLLTSFSMSGLPLRNRVVLAPMTRARSGVERIPNALMASYYEQRASAGLLITEATVISNQGIGWSQSPGIMNDAQTEGWRPVVNAVHGRGAPIFLQLWHCGRASHTSFHPEDGPPVSASAIRLEGDHIHTPTGKHPYEVPRALETDEVRRTVVDYQKAATRARDAGFNGVEIHAANGYLVDQFLQSKTNHRQDEYGGSLPNRYRFLDEIVRAVSEVFPANRIGVRLSPNGVFNDMGSPDYRETFVYVAEQLNHFGLAYLHVMDGLAFGFHNLGDPMTLADFRKVFSSALIGNCGYTQETAEAAIDAGHADLIAFGRPYISNPDLVERFRNGRPLTPLPEMSVWYSHGPAGYADFPAYSG